jgi:ATP-dependent Clp protease ATP-binding subunit ClpX
MLRPAPFSSRARIPLFAYVIYSCFGLIPEFVGRLPIASVLGELKQEDLERVLVETKNALTKQYRKLFAMENVRLTFEHEALAAIAKKALELKTGARGLRSIMEKMMLETMYDLPNHPGTAEVVITAASVEGKEPPKMLPAKN